MTFIAGEWQPVSARVCLRKEMTCETHKNSCTFRFLLDQSHHLFRSNGLIMQKTSLSLVYLTFPSRWFSSLFVAITENGRPNPRNLRRDTIFQACQFDPYHKSVDQHSSSGCDSGNAWTAVRWCSPPLPQLLSTILCSALLRRHYRPKHP